MSLSSFIRVLDMLDIKYYAIGLLMAFSLHTLYDTPTRSAIEIFSIVSQLVIYHWCTKSNYCSWVEQNFRTELWKSSQEGAAGMAVIGEEIVFSWSKSFFRLILLHPISFPFRRPSLTEEYFIYHEFMRITQFITAALLTARAKI